MLEYLWMGIGVIMFLLRIYLVEYPLHRVFSHEKHFLSRYLNLFFWILMMLQFQSNLINFCILMGFPVLLYSFFFNDTKILMILIKKKSPIPDTKEKFWLIFERLTLHLPVLIYIFCELFTKNQPFFTDLTLFESFGGFLLNFGLYLILDPRKPWKKPEYSQKWEQYGILTSNILTGIFLLLFFT